MPIVVLVAFVTMLIAGAAWAAWTIYTEVTAPQADEQQEAIESPAPKQGADANKPAEEAAPAAAGEPEHVLQVAEILAMDPADAPAFLESQGLAFEEKDSSRGPFSAGGSSWSHALNDPSVFAAAESSGATIDLEARMKGVPMSIAFGNDVLPPHGYQYADLARYGATKNDFTDGKAATNILIWNAPLPIMGDDQLSAFLAACKLSAPLASYSQKGDSIATVHTGVIDIDSTPYYWYVVQQGNPASTEATKSAFSFMGCFPASKAPQLVEDADLYTAAEWDQADEETHALMVGQSILQGAYTRDGGGRINIRTGEQEMISPYPSKDSAESKYVNKKKYSEINGEDLAQGRFDATFGRS